MLFIINTFKPKGFPHYYQLDQSISVLRVVGFLGGVFHFLLILIEQSDGKRWRSWSDDTFCGIWSGSTLFAYVPQNGQYAYMG